MNTKDKRRSKNVEKAPLMNPFERAWSSYKQGVRNMLQDMGLAKKPYEYAERHDTPFSRAAKRGLEERRRTGNWKARSK